MTVLTKNDKDEVKGIAEGVVKEHEHKERSVKLRKQTLNMTVEVTGPEDLDALNARAIDTLKKIEKQ